MNNAPSDPAQPYRNLSAGYTDSIRASDAKASNGILFAAFMMSPTLANYTRFPDYLPISFVLLPFLIVYLCLFLVLIPRYPRRGSGTFIVSRTAIAEDFTNDANEIEQRKLQCAVFSELLWWKTLYLNIGFIVSIICIAATIFLLLYIWWTGA